MSAFIDRLCNAVLTSASRDEDVRREIGRTVADTVAVAAAGFAEPVTQSTISAYAGAGPRAWNGTAIESRDAAVMVNAVAAHALDFDDVYLDSGSHSSAVIVPAALTLDDGPSPDMVIDACAAGLVAARGVGMMLGRKHYQRGWHATSTVGVFSATAAAATIAGLDSIRLRYAFGLAAAMAGGLQLNFSTMAKPAHAGFAASAGIRAVRLAATGVTAADDIFAPGGFGDLYDAENQGEDDDVFALRPDRVAVKLFPSCYATSRLIGVALDARRETGPIFANADVTARLTTPAGSLRVLKYDRPTDGAQAKFSPTFPVAAALLDGSPVIAHFTAEGVTRSDIADMIDRLDIVEDPDRFYDGNLETGSVTLEIFDRDERIVMRERSAIPGTDADPVTRDKVRDKAAGCFAAYRTSFGEDFPLLARVRAIPEVAHWID
ncbi:MAG: MmgE/PrpD family protein [Sphingomonas sp.]|uniref:MmgE/PrpD family protein n=1 Tax=Sphingomonas sp. TaxID=28214 RepID=UPI001AD2877A|nr:MmgE/PrpD family protein [Sphingomonas sp.]MBN8816819.1 MmgE/PrpD family protein [Sphingomonas sp.]